MQIFLIITGTIITIFATCIGEKVLKIINQKIRNEKGRNILRHIKNIVLDNVKATYQNCVKELKEKNQFNKNEKIEVLDRTKDNIINSLSYESKEFIKITYCNIDSFVICQIEKTLYDLKF